MCPLGDRHVGVEQSEREADLRSRRLSMAGRPCPSGRALAAAGHFDLPHHTDLLIYMCADSKQVFPSGVQV